MAPRVWRFKVECGDSHFTECIESPLTFHSFFGAMIRHLCHHISYEDKEGEWKTLRTETDFNAACDLWGASRADTERGFGYELMADRPPIHLSGKCTSRDDRCADSIGEIFSRGVSPNVVSDIKGLETQLRGGEISFREFCAQSSAVAASIHDKRFRDQYGEMPVYRHTAARISSTHPQIDGILWALASLSDHLSPVDLTASSLYLLNNGVEYVTRYFGVDSISRDEIDNNATDPYETAAMSFASMWRKYRWMFDQLLKVTHPYITKPTEDFIEVAEFLDKMHSDERSDGGTETALFDDSQRSHADSFVRLHKIVAAFIDALSSLPHEEQVIIAEKYWEDVFIRGKEALASAFASSSMDPNLRHQRPCGTCQSEILGLMYLQKVNDAEAVGNCANCFLKFFKSNGCSPTECVVPKTVPKQWSIKDANRFAKSDTKKKDEKAVFVKTVRTVSRCNAPDGVLSECVTEEVVRGHNEAGEPRPLLTSKRTHIEKQNGKQTVCHSSVVDCSAFTEQIAQ
eukprot:GHVO01017233.1.p1 GENE.GHVO01017233.1~~GHVO01017233.1.p1  ORF type:complete len:543 (-),score=51.62 GHVO01017233.1:137-1681(-)